MIRDPEQHDWHVVSTQWERMSEEEREVVLRRAYLGNHDHILRRPAKKRDIRAETHEQTLADIRELHAKTHAAREERLSRRSNIRPIKEGRNAR